MPVKKTKTKTVSAKKEKPVGKVTHFFGHISVAVVKVLSPIKVGDKLEFKGATTNFEQEASSMQVEHKQVESAKKGNAVGMKVKNKVREGDLVFKAE